MQQRLTHGCMDAVRSRPESAFLHRADECDSSADLACAMLKIKKTVGMAGRCSRPRTWDRLPEQVEACLRKLGSLVSLGLLALPSPPPQHLQSLPVSTSRGCWEDRLAIQCTKTCYGQTIILRQGSASPGRITSETRVACPKSTPLQIA